MKADLKKRFAKILVILKKTYPKAGLALRVRNPLETYVATVLSAQCTDIRVNIVTKELFAKFKKPEDYVSAPVKTLEKYIKSVGLYKAKAKSIRAGCRTIVEKFGGKVPDTMDELLQLGGVGRKTANVILGNAFGKPGIAVDTHVKRLANRIGLTSKQDPVKIEFELMALLPERDWTISSHLLIFHGRNICHARKPLCESCPIAALCDTGKKMK